MPHFSIARLVGTGTSSDPFRAPTVEEYSLIDFRPLSSQKLGKTDGWALVATRERDTALGVYLGDNSTEISPVVSRLLSSRFGVNLDADPTLGELIGELLIVHATSPKDDSRWNAVAPQKVVTPRGTLNRFEAYLGNEVVWSAETLSTEGGQQYADNFNRANASTPGSPWVVQTGAFPISSSKLLVTGTSDNLLIYNAALNSNDHWAAFDMVSGDANFRGIDAQVRHQSTAAAGTDVSCYGTGYIIAGGSYEIYKKNAQGNQTTLFSQSGSNPQSATIRTDINGSTLKGTVSGTVRGTVTDTSITAGKYVGLFVYQGSSQITLDNFTGSDYQATFAADGTIGMSGVELSTTRKKFVGAIASAGVLTRVRAVFRQFLGTIGSSGTLARAFSRKFAGTIQPTHTALKRSVTKFHTGTVASSAKLKFMTIRKFAGNINVTGVPTIAYIGRIAGKAGYAVGNLRKAANIRAFLRPGRRQ